MENYSYYYPQDRNRESITQEDKEYRDWTADWWKWVLSYDYRALFLDQDGSNIMKYQPDDNKEVYFLTGAYNAEQVRNVTISKGMHVLAPVLNGIYSEMNSRPIDAFGLRDRLVDAGHINTIEYLEARLDNKLIPYTRITSDVFEVAYRNDSAYQIPPEFVGMPVPTVSDGYWVILEPDQLSLGTHELYLHGINENGYSTQVRYNIDIV